MIFVNKKWEHTKLNIMKNLISVLIFSLITNCLYAQDRIVTLTGDTIYCEVVYIVQGKMTMIPRGSKNESVIDMNILTRYQWLDKWYAVHTVPQNYTIVIESDSVSQKKLFARTMNFITDHWVSAEKVIDYTDNIYYDDIVIKYKISHTVYENLNLISVTHVFTTMVKFNHKDGKSRIEVILYPNSKTISSNLSTFPSINILEPYGGYNRCWIREKNYIEIRNVVLESLPKLINDYKKFLNDYKNNNNDW